MNENTRIALIEFIEEVEQLAIGCTHMAGADQVKDVIASGENLKMALAKDETIPCNS